MSGFEPSSDDVVLMNASDNLMSNTSTYKINQLKNTLREYLKAFSKSAATWLEDGVECQFLEAQAGGGWKKGKIRLRVEIVLDEPEPKSEPELEPKDPDANFLDSLRADNNPQQ